MPETNETEFVKGTDTIHWGDAVSVLQERITDESVDLVFADPPFNIGKKFANFVDKWPTEEAYVTWCQTWLDLSIAKLAPTGSMYVMTSTQMMPYLDSFLRERICIRSRIVWTYDSSGVQARSYFGSMYEPILFCVKDKRNYTFNVDAIEIEAKTGAKRKLIDYRKPEPAQYRTKKVPGNVWHFPRVRYRMAEYEEHPSQKPTALLRRIILASSNEGDTVLDPFSGTFTTSAVGKELGRRTIGIEQEEDYVKIGLRRLAIREHWNGEPLLRPQKTYVRRNGARPTKPLSPEQTPGLFEGQAP